MTKLVAGAVLVAWFSATGLVAVDAQAQDAETKPAGGAAAAPPATTYDFEDDLVTGDLVRPDGELLSVRRRGNRASLIQIREHFIPEMLKSIEDL
jgi:hypothetical protein